MGRVKQQLNWMTRGGTHAQGAIDEQAAAIRELQRQVAELTTVLARIDAGRVDGAEWTLLRDDLRQAVDDLGGRIGALAERVEGLES
jgi:hypothetical protein